MRSHEIDYKISGHDVQLVEIELDRGETVIAEAGAMLYMEEGIAFETRMGDGSEPNQGLLGKLLSAGSRLITGESLFITHFTHQGNGKAHVAFSAPYPGTIVPLDLRDLGGILLYKKMRFCVQPWALKYPCISTKNLALVFLEVKDSYCNDWTEMAWPSFTQVVPSLKKH